MARFQDQDLSGAEFRECDLSRARLIGVVMQDAVIDGLVGNLVVNGVEVTSYVDAELDRRHPVRLLIRSADPAGLREAVRQLRAGWAATLGLLTGPDPPRPHPARRRDCALHRSPVTTVTCRPSARWRVSARDSSSSSGLAFRT